MRLGRPSAELMESYHTPPCKVIWHSVCRSLSQTWRTVCRSLSVGFHAGPASAPASRAAASAPASAASRISSSTVPNKSGLQEHRSTLHFLGSHRSRLSRFTQIVRDCRAFWRQSSPSLPLRHLRTQTLSFIMKFMHLDKSPTD